MLFMLQLTQEGRVRVPLLGLGVQGRVLWIGTIINPKGPSTSIVCTFGGPNGY